MSQGMSQRNLKADYLLTMTINNRYYSTSRLATPARFELACLGGNPEKDIFTINLKLFDIH